MKISVNMVRQVSQLAAAADVLGGQLRRHLVRFAAVVSPHSAALNRAFMTRLRASGYSVKQRSALAAITPGAAANVLSGGRSQAAFFEVVNYNGRRLAKLGLPPSAVSKALAIYDALLRPVLRRGHEKEYPNLLWVREQLQFCTLLTLNSAYYEVREEEAQSFYRLSRAELESHTVEELLNRCVEILAGFARADRSALYLLSPDRAQLVPGAAPGGKPASRVPVSPALLRRLQKPRCFAGAKAPGLLLNSAWKKDISTCWSVPLLRAGEIAGVMQFGFRRLYDWLPREQEMLRAAAERAMLAAEKARLMDGLAASEAQIRSLAEHMLHVEEVERQRISRELHDETGQSLLCIRLQLEMLQQLLGSGDPVLERKAAEIRKLTEKTIVEMRRLIAALSPSVLQQLGLAAAIRQLGHHLERVKPIRVRLRIGDLPALPKQVQLIAYRILQECCNNILKHSEATSVNILVCFADGRLGLKVEDNGIGFDPGAASAAGDSFGIAGMRERVALLGGAFEIQSRSSKGLRSRRKGTTIGILLPGDLAGRVVTAGRPVPACRTSGITKD
ncbi:MAG TPA: GAF domain-containing sensor histidine kinase [Bryobacteraceae bacterium]|nr:GAF domain-containing sensor histidine kinase [Bryobacteraceae bacterium]